MRWSAFVGLIVAVFVVGTLLLVGGPRQALRATSDARDLAALPQVPIAPLLELNGEAPDLVVFQAADAGWFELDMDALPPGLEVGIYGPRFFDVVTNYNHVPLYCSGPGRPGKILWVIQDAQIARDFAFCDFRRMDLSALRPFSHPVEMVEASLSRADVLALADSLAEDPDRAAVLLATNMSALSDRRIVTLPMLWFLPESATPQDQLEAQIEAAILDHLGNGQVQFQRRNYINPNHALTLADGQQVTGMAVSINGQTGLIEGASAEAYALWISCPPEDCARLDTLDFAALIAPGRDLEGLRAAFEGAIVEEAESDATISTAPTLEDFEADTVDIGPVVPVTYLTRYIQRPPSGN